MTTGISGGEAAINLVKKYCRDGESMADTIKRIELATEKLNYIGKTPPRAYKEDHSQTNPGLHELYVGWAMHHLVLLNKTIKKFDRFANTNVTGISSDLWHRRQALIDNNTAYRDAAARLMAGHEPPPMEEGNTDESISCSEVRSAISAS